VPEPGSFVPRLLEALDEYDEAAAQHAVAEVLDRYDLEDALTQVLMPFLVEVGSRWAAGEVSVTQEHFASHIVRSRLAGLGALAARIPPSDDRPKVVVACPPGERHDIAPLAFSVLLRRAGRQVRYLGADTPVLDLASAFRRIRPDLVVVAASRPTALLGSGRELRRIAARNVLAIAGAGASRKLAKDLGGIWLDGDVTDGARRALTMLHGAPTG
jgi:methanogenic corrinoid protein MtbC1